MDKETFIKRKLEIIANDFSDSGIDIPSDITGKIMAELSDIYDEGFNEGYDHGWRQSFYTYL